MRYWMWYLIFINIMACLLYGLDKQKARRNRWRIPEATLLGIALLGGSAGALTGMYLFHHKTKKIKFYLGVPFILIAEAGLWIYLYVLK